MKRPSLRKIVLRSIVGVFIVAAVIILTQDVQIFPGIFLIENTSAPLPEGVTRHAVLTEDGESINVWRLPAISQSPKKFSAIVMHGNYGTVRDFFAIQRWFQKQGITSYGYDFRGYGLSTGWPSERGLYQDSAAVWKFIQEQDDIEPDSLVVFGLSIGTGIAAELASKLKPAALVLVSPYASLPEVAKDQPVTGLLAPFLRYDLPTAKYVSNLSSTCLLLAHADNDTIISYRNSDLVLAAYHGQGMIERYTSHTAGHNYMFNESKKQLAVWISDCLQKPATK